MMSSNLWVLLILTIWAGVVQPVQAVSPGAAPSAEAPVIGAATPQGVEIAPMSDPAIQGAACLGFAAVSMAAAYAAGPMEALMLMSGAQHIATGSVIMFIPMLSILGGGACALAATAEPSLDWLIDQSGNIGDQFGALMDGWFSGRAGDEPLSSAASAATSGHDFEETTNPPAPIRPMTEVEVQSSGCVVGALAGFGASMASSPMEIAMLSSGATTIVSSTPLLVLGLLATVVGAGCGIGSFVAVPTVALINQFSK